MQRMGQMLITAVAVSGACAGGAMAVASATGVSPLAMLSAGPVATMQAAVATVSQQPNALPTAVETLAATPTQVTQEMAAAPSTGIVEAVYRAGARVVDNVVSAATATAAPVTNAKSGASAAYKEEAPAAVGANAAPATDAKSGASGSKQTSAQAATGGKAPATSATSGASGAGEGDDDDRYSNERDHDDDRDDDREGDDD